MRCRVLESKISLMMTVCFTATCKLSLQTLLGWLRVSARVCLLAAKHGGSELSSQQFVSRQQQALVTCCGIPWLHSTENGLMAQLSTPVSRMPARPARHPNRPSRSAPQHSPLYWSILLALG